MRKLSTLWIRWHNLCSLLPLSNSPAITWRPVWIPLRATSNACVAWLCVSLPHLYPETPGCQSCGSLLHPTAPDLSLYAHHWFYQSRLHLWSCLRHTHKEYVLMFSRLRHSSSHTHKHTDAHTYMEKLMMVYSHMAALLLFMQGSAHASRASATSSHSKGLYGGSAGSPDTPTHNQTWAQPDWEKILSKKILSYCLSRPWQS